MIHTSAVIGKNVKLGEGVIIHPFVVIEDNVEIGNFVEIFPGAYIGKEPKGAGALSRKIEFKKQIKIEDHSSIGPHAIVYYDVEIGKNTLIGDGASIREQCVIGSRVVIGRYVTINYGVTIGYQTKIMDHTWIAGNMTIGENVFISGGVLTANDNKMGSEGYGDHVQGPRIENHSKIGVGAILLPNINIGENTVIAAGAVVTKSVPSYAVAKGIPAKHEI